MPPTPTPKPRPGVRPAQPTTHPAPAAVTSPAPPPAPPPAATGPVESESAPEYVAPPEPGDGGKPSAASDHWQRIAEPIARSFIESSVDAAASATGVCPELVRQILSDLAQQWGT